MYSKSEIIYKKKYFLNFKKYIEKKKNDYQDINNNSNIEKLNKVINDIHQIMVENINLTFDRGKLLILIIHLLNQL